MSASRPKASAKAQRLYQAGHAEAGLCLACSRPADKTRHYCWRHAIMKRLNRAGCKRWGTWRPVQRDNFIEYLRTRYKAIREGELAPCLTVEAAFQVLAAAFSSLKVQWGVETQRHKIALLIMRLDKEAYLLAQESGRTPSSRNTLASPDAPSNDGSELKD